MAKNKKLHITKWIGYVLFLVSMFGWGLSTGKLYQKVDSIKIELDNISTKIDQQQNLLLQQEKLNGEILILIELMKEDYANKSKIK